MNEWKLLELVARKVPAAGDDCAVIPFADTNLLLTTDLLHQSSDFPPGATPYTIGWRSVAVSLSDIAAMGGRPLAAVLAASGPAWDELLPGVLAGAKEVAEAAGCELVGGDLDFSEELTLVSTVLGEADHPVMRAGARPGDLVCLTGPLGRTALALKRFEQGQPEEGNRLFRFTPRVKEGRKLAQIATSMIDISDGLAHSLHLLARASGVGFEIRAADLPLIAGLAEAFGEEALNKALYYGEDYELLFTVPLELFEPGLGIPIGEAVPSGVRLLEGHERRPLPDKGWEHGA